MKVRTQLLALAAVLALAALPTVAKAFSDCPADHVSDGYTCTEQKGEGKTGGFFRVTFPSDWDGDLVIVNHGFDLNDLHRRPHESCSHVQAVACEQDADCGPNPNNFCNEISYLGLDEVLLPMGKAVAAGTYTDSGWAVFHSAKDIKDIIKYVKKESGFGDQLKRVIITGFSGGGAVTADATLNLKIDGAVPLCAAAGGGLPTWDVAQDIRLIYDYLCDGVTGASFISAPDVGQPNSLNSSNDAIGLAIKVDKCFGIFGVPTVDQADRLAKFLALTGFTGDASHGGSNINLASAMGFAVLGLGDFVLDPERLKGQRIGLNDTLDYTSQGTGGQLATDFNTDVERLTVGKGRKALSKKSNPDFTKGKGKKVAYPILSMAGANDWLVIPEFQRVYTDALTAGNKAYTQTWIDTYGHCVFSEQEVTAIFTKYFEWLGPVGGPYGTQPTQTDIENACLALPGGIDDDTCNFNGAFSPGAIYDRIPQRADWPAAATNP